MSDEKYFTIEEADQLLLDIDTKLKEIQAAKRKLVARGVDEEDIYELIESCLDDPHETALEFFDDKPLLKPLVHKMMDLVDDILEHGVVIKDLDIGLVDFPSWFEGREVYLCHKLGEDRIKSWHEIDQGFRGRQPILELDMILDD